MRKRKKSDGSSRDDSLLQMMTISLFIILLAFFILLNAIAVTDSNKTRKVIGSIVESFGGETSVEPSEGNYSEEVFTNGVSPVEFKNLTAGTDKNLKDITIQGTRKRTTMSIPDVFLFNTNGTKLKRSRKKFLRDLSKVIKTNKFPVYITCHLDDIPIFDNVGITGRELTTLRSVKLLRYFIEVGKLPAKQVTAAGWGMEKQLVSNKTAKTRKMNRRVDITFVHDNAKKKKGGFFIFKDFFFNVDN